MFKNKLFFIFYGWFTVKALITYLSNCHEIPIIILALVNLVLVFYVYLFYFTILFFNNNKSEEKHNKRKNEIK